MPDKPLPIQWPLPPSAGPSAVSLVQQGDCEIELFSGHKLSGLLAVWPPPKGVLEIAAVGGGAAKRVEMEAVRSLVLTQPIVLPESDIPPAPDRRLALRFESRPFVIKYRDGPSRSGTTHGFLGSRAGTYLYVGTEGLRVTPWFVPASAGRVDVGEAPEQALELAGAATPAQLALAAQRQAELRSKPIGEYLIERGMVSPSQLADVLALQSLQPVMRLGDILVSQGLVAAYDLRRALERQREDHERPLGDILVEMNLVDHDTVTRTLAAQLGIPFVDARKFAIEKDALKLVSPSLAYLHRMIPLYRDGQTLVVAADHPLDQDFINELRFATDLHVLPVLGLTSDILARLQTEYGLGDGGDAAFAAAEADSVAPAGAGNSASELISLINAESALHPGVEPASDATAADSNALVRLVTRVILDAYAQGASDIHIETNPGNRETRIRFRKDGVLVDYMNLPAILRAATVSRIKIMSELDISEHRHPQDGKIGFEQYGGVKLDLRVAVLPTANGLEDVVMRLLSSSRPMPIAKLGLSGRNLAHIKALARRPFGMVLVCGPTGSGKTTTLHSVLADINTPELKIWTAEDPIEIVHIGLRQMQVNPKIGLTFAKAMRSFLRADPDVIMVGEMRDQETAKTGIEASLTGHLVFSTLHTNGAAESIVRLLDLGMDPFNFADALLGILAQRLVRRLCPACKRPHQATAAELSALAEEYCSATAVAPGEVLASWRDLYGASVALHAAAGCDACQGSGFKGRLGIHELLVSNARIKQLIQIRAPVVEIQAESMRGGMQTLRQDGIEKVLQGHTDMPQVRSACS